MTYISRDVLVSRFIPLAHTSYTFGKCKEKRRTSIDKPQEKRVK